MALFSGDSLAKLVARAGSLNVLRGIRPHLPVRWLTVLRYGRIGPARDNICEAASARCSPQLFEAQMSWLRDECTPIDLERLRTFFSGQELPGRPALVMFDNVYFDNIEYALPTLSRYGVSALFFAATDCVTATRPYWWDRVHHMVHACTRSELILSYPTRLVFQLPAERQHAVRTVLRIAQTHYRLDRSRFMTELQRACGLQEDRDTEERHLAEQQLMSWTQLGRLRDAGMAIQSGAASGWPLHTLNMAAAVDELSRSRAALLEHLGVEASALALPPGTPPGAPLVLGPAMNKAGYRICFTEARGAMPLWRPAKPLQIQHIAASDYHSESRFKSALHWPALARRVW